MRKTADRVFRLPEADRTLIQSLKEYRGRADRYEALLDLIPIVKDMDVPKVVKEERRPIKVKIPEELFELLNARSDESGQTVVDLLLKAAQIYKDGAEEADEG